MEGQHSAPLSSGTNSPKLWAIGGGKGGVGKSLISSSLAYAAAKFGSKTIAIDLDLGGANLHTVLGLDAPKISLADYVFNRVQNLNDCVTDTPYPNLKIISGAHDDLRIPNIDHNKQQQLLHELRRLDADIVILDLGAGTNPYTLEFFNASDIGVLTVLTEPTSIENAYRFIKSAYFTRLAQRKELWPVRNLIEETTNPANTFGLRTPTDLLNEIALRDKNLALEFKKAISEFQPKLIINQTRSQADVDVGYSMKAVCKKYFGIDLEFLGYLDYDSSVWQSVRKKRPMMVEFPTSKLALSIERMSNYLLRQTKASQNAPRR